MPLSSFIWFKQRWFHTQDNVNLNHRSTLYDLNLRDEKRFSVMFDEIYNNGMFCHVSQFRHYSNVISIPSIYKFLYSDRLIWNQHDKMRFLQKIMNQNILLEQTSAMHSCMSNHTYKSSLFWTQFSITIWSPNRWRQYIDPDAMQLFGIFQLFQSLFKNRSKENQSVTNQYLAAFMGNGNKFQV